MKPLMSVKSYIDCIASDWLWQQILAQALLTCKLKSKLKPSKKIFPVLLKYTTTLPCWCIPFQRNHLASCITDCRTVPSDLKYYRGIRHTSKNNKYWAKRYILTGIKDLGWKRPDIKTIKNKAFFTYV